MSTIRDESAHAINGVAGRMFALNIPPAPWKAGTFANQTWISEARPIVGYVKGATLRVNAHFDDNCRNGHNDFAITAEVRRPRARDIDAGGMLHKYIAEVFPELAPLLKWHGVGTEGPMHYVVNTVYHASDRDHHGLLKGESRQIRNGKSGLPSWQLSALVDGEYRTARVDGVPNYIDAAEQPPAPAGLVYAPWCRIGEGKARELAYARSSAVWPDATDEELYAPADELRRVLAFRLPFLMQAFRADMEAAGFMWSSLPAMVD